MSASVWALGSSPSSSSKRLAQHAVLTPGEVGLASAGVRPDQRLMGRLVGRIVDDQRFEHRYRRKWLTGGQVEPGEIERGPFAGAA